MKVSGRGLRVKGLRVQGSGIRVASLGLQLDVGVTRIG